MIRKLAFTFIITFLCGQLYTVAHMAEHAFEEHEHENIACEVYHYSEQAQSADTSLTSILFIPVAFTLLHTCKDSIASKAVVGLEQARAPPVLSQYT